MATSVKLALIGCGNIAQAHWRGIQTEAPQIEVTTIVDTDSKQAAAMSAATGAQAFDSLQQALAKGDFDAVDIMLPHHLHEEAATAAFAAGKHVVLEKPMAPTLDACDRILAAAQAAGTVFMVAEQSHYWPDALKVRELLQSGTLGEVVTARAYFGHASGIHTGPIPWRYELAKSGGGICMDGGAHWIRPLRMWLGEIDEVVAVTGRQIPEMEGESYARSMLRFESGVVAIFDALNGGMFIGPGEEFRITGTLGELVIEKSGDGNLILFDRDHPNGDVIMSKRAGRGAASFGYELNDFSRAVLEGKSLEAGPEYSLGELRTALAIYRSAESKQWEKVWA